ncbi:cytochrome P450 [Aliifodinibius sp. S!AR15-10]|uniref:cytochrome P450 n=1 Tax=Aliifodinibius sp. S!AR15-10 TaxID=2950437 RepID=UPI0028618935|nr:cytochrome P450 [Aliifodinibius sp. S!AR15-10]MDR8394302.1 cytochrome P450 [Aliifodinibius sp. S!AR15-10]
MMFDWVAEKLVLFNKKAAGRRPPGPDGLPLFGSLLQARRKPLHFAQNLIQKYGDIVHFKIGFFTGYLLNHPEYVKQVLSLNHQNYNKQNYNYQKLKPVLGEGLITGDGETWAMHRRLIQPIFHRSRLASFGEITTKTTKQMLEEWALRVNSGQPVDIAADMMRLTLEVVTESLFSADIRSSIDLVRNAFTTLNEDIAYRFRTAFVPPLWVPTRRNRAFIKARDELDQLVFDIVERRRENGESKDDLLERLLEAGEGLPVEHELTDRQIRDEVITLLLAGHETTANLLTWTLHLLSQHPGVAQKLRDELAKVLQGREPSVDDLSELQYMEMVLKESVRLYPPVWIISRKAIDNDMIDGYTIPAGSTVTLCIYTLHRHPEFWDDPEAFIPERFSGEQSQNRDKYAYLPFGGGPRSCIGKYFALMEAQLVLAMICRQYHLKPVDNHVVEPEPLVTLRPLNGLKMVFRPVDDNN